MCSELLQAVGHWQLAYRLLRAMQRLRSEVDLPCHTVALTACHQVQRWEEALHVGCELQPDVACRNCFMDLWGTGGHWQKALELFEGLRMEAFEPRKGSK